MQMSREWPACAAVRRAALRHVLQGMLVALTAAACAAKPCTNCPNVAGTYWESSPALKAVAYCTPAGNLTWFLDWTTISAPVTVVQNGSALTIETSVVGGHNLPATLYDDGSVQSGTVSYMQSLPDEPTVIEPAALTLTGNFETPIDPTASGSVVFNGTYGFSSPSNNCAESAVATWAVPAPDGGVPDAG